MNSDTQRQDELRAAWHEGYTAALHRRETATWQLDRERLQVARRLREWKPDEDQPMMRHLWQTVMGEYLPDLPRGSDSQLTCMLRDRLIHLLDGEKGVEIDPNLQKSPNPINKDAESPSYFMESADFNKLGKRKATISKLERLQFDGGSHENLSRLAYAIYPCATGWTCESAAGLRDMLVWLLGGSDGGHCESTCQHCDACSDVRAGGVGESTETITAELRKYVEGHRMGGDGLPETMWGNSVPYDLLQIADRIDAQFDRICQQQEAVLQSMIETTIDADKITHERYVRRIEKLVKQRDTYLKLAKKNEEWCDKLAKKRDELAATMEQLKDELDRIKGLLQ